MKFELGDKVKFIDEEGGGFITKVLQAGLVEVSIEDGFSIPYSTSELLKVDDQGTASQFFDEDFGNRPDISKEEELISNQVSTELFKRKSLDLKKGIYLTFVPQDQKWLMTGLIEVYLINYTDYDLLFSLFLSQDEGFNNKEYDVIGPQNKFLIDTIDREDINDWLKGQIQALFIKSDSEKIVAPLNKKFQIKGAKFYQESNYKHIDLLQANAFVLEIAAMDYQEMISKADPIAEKDIKEIPETKVVIKKKKSLIEQHKIGSLEAEVDLHISALNDDYGHLKPHEILEEQMDYFNKTIEDAMLHQFHKIIYIHGIGNGSLKKKLKDELRDYEEIEVRD
ncbi:MAG: DUF2027 domain-containing protein, partial [Bacteroidales bacterium]|nr:DUF2027 domain-containing protein [Bacteroidales bacterium]